MGGGEAKNGFGFGVKVWAEGASGSCNRDRGEVTMGAWVFASGEVVVVPKLLHLDAKRPVTLLCLSRFLTYSLP